MSLDATVRRHAAALKLPHDLNFTAAANARSGSLIRGAAAEAHAAAERAAAAERTAADGGNKSEHARVLVRLDKLCVATAPTASLTCCYASFASLPTSPPTTTSDDKRGEVGGAMKEVKAPTMPPNKVRDRRTD